MASFLRKLVKAITRAGRHQASESPAEEDLETRAIPAYAPKYLYKYCSAERAVQILRDQYLYLCPFENLNDMYEGTVAPGLKYSAELARELQIRRIMAIAGESRQFAEEFVRESSSADREKEVFDYFATTIRETAKAMRKHGGVACLSADFSNQRMWGTYGDSHQGVCLQFWQDEGRSVIHKLARPVIYTNENRTDLLIKLMDEDGAISPPALGLMFYLTKSVEWKGEHEWRIVMLATTEQGADDRRIRFPATNIRRVFLGPRIDKQRREQVFNIARQHATDWGVLDVEIDVDSGRANFVGMDVIKHSDDFAWYSRHSSE
jgi:hypothetical protein